MVCETTGINSIVVLTESALGFWPIGRGIICKINPRHCIVYVLSVYKVFENSYGCQPPFYFCIFKNQVKASNAIQRIYCGKMSN